MCGRFALTLPREAVLSWFRATPSPKLAERLGDLPPRWNVSPTQDIPVVLIHEGARLLAPLRWGFIPRWCRTLGQGPLLINARSETIAEKPAFRAACRERRCLIPATGFYEWRDEAGRKQPYWIRPAGGAPDGSLFAFAGVWETWRGPDGQRIAACAIVTGPASQTLAPLHHREPQVIAPEDHALWLGEDGPGAARLMRPAPENFWSYEKASPLVKDVNPGEQEIT